MGLISIRFSGKDEDDYNYCMRTLTNIREDIIKDTSSWRVGLREVMVKLCKYWVNGSGDIISDSKGNNVIKPYYYNQEKLNELYDLVERGKRNINTAKQTEIEKIMPEILLLEKDNAMIKVIDNMRDRNIIIALYGDYINGILTEKITEYLKKENV